MHVVVGCYIDALGAGAPKSQNPLYNSWLPETPKAYVVVLKRPPPPGVRSTESLQQHCILNLLLVEQVSSILPFGFN